MTGQRIGYIRVSTFDQNPERQLEGVKVDRAFSDKASGKDVKRPQLEALISFARTGDGTVAKLAMRQPFVLFKGLTFQKLCLPGAFRPGDHHNRYGEQLQGELRWKGMVIGASEGTEVKAIADGRVILADWLQGYGLVVVVEHGKGDMSLYGYNQSALVSVGSQVRAGQPIALVGSSGGQGRPSLYFEIRRQGQAVNPQPWLGR